MTIPTYTFDVNLRNNLGIRFKNTSQDERIQDAIK